MATEFISWPLLTLVSDDSICSCRFESNSFLLFVQHFFTHTRSHRWGNSLADVLVCSQGDCHLSTLWLTLLLYGTAGQAVLMRNSWTRAHRLAAFHPSGFLKWWYHTTTAFRIVNSLWGTWCGCKVANDEADEVRMRFPHDNGVGAFCFAFILLAATVTSLLLSDCKSTCILFFLKLLWWIF